MSVRMGERSCNKPSCLHDTDEAAFIAQQVDLPQRIALDEQQIGFFAWRDRSHLTVNADQSGSG